MHRLWASELGHTGCGRLIGTDRLDTLLGLMSMIPAESSSIQSHLSQKSSPFLGACEAAPPSRQPGPTNPSDRYLTPSAICSCRNSPTTYRPESCHCRRRLALDVVPMIPPLVDVLPDLGWRARWTARRWSLSGSGRHSLFRFVGLPVSSSDGNESDSRRC